MLGETYQVILDNPDDDPTIYEEALEDKDVQEWKKVIDRGMESMGSNSIWSLVESSRGINPIVSKWIYMRQKDKMGSLKPSKLDWWQKVIPRKMGWFMMKLFLQ